MIKATSKDSDGQDGDASTSCGSDEMLDTSGKEGKHKGKLLIDATCVHADTRYPTDLGLLN